MAEQRTALVTVPAERNIFDLSPEQLAALLAEWGEPSYRAKQVLHWLYKELAADFSEMSNLPLELRRKLDATLRIGSGEIVAQKISADGWTRKLLMKLRDGSTVEAVLMLYYDRATVCISSQVGCAMGCSFCATGQMGFTRNLSTGEIVEQVVYFNRWLRDHPHRPLPTALRGARYAGKKAGVGQMPAPQMAPQQLDESAWHVPDYALTSDRRAAVNAVTNVVFMGMGEPLLNYKSLWGAIRTLNSPQALGMGARRITVSTVGVAPQIRRLGHEELAINLAVSLHAPNDELRTSLVPMNNRYPIAEVMAACKGYFEATHRRITFEYVLISGQNDHLEHARQLGVLLKGVLCHVNLIPLNPVAGTGMQATPREQVYAFQRIVEEEGIPTTVRIERGVDIAAACGQLKVEEEPYSRRSSLNPELVQAHVQADLASQL
ncbi:MAG: 23S rRNA (adenine(2503)-C(2))-methyltransferase RlmN [Chloroflexi bacterium]|nr:23S rRNA (adenine(2503)-C(2))-methyltransferase RlmN [Chloroflexota bacterium]